MSCSPAAIASAENSAGRADVGTAHNQTKENSDHLARIRENQRRSRARKREYVSDLESKIKGCQEEGLQLNIQIQRVARRVVEENKKLRELLAQVGIDEWTVEDYLKSKSGEDFQSWITQRHQEEEILKAQHPCRTCGTAPAKAKDENMSRSKSKPVVAAASLESSSSSVPAVVTAPRPAGVAILPQPPFNPAAAALPSSRVPVAAPPQVFSGAPQYPSNMLPYGMNAVGPSTMVHPQPPAAAAAGDSATVLPIDFTAYFQSVDIDSIQLPNDFYTSSASSSSAQNGANSSSESSASCCASSASSASSPECTASDVCASKSQ
ncbi:hypothetical protein BZA70DRAFT_268511 [Myxozyma melibiosi]|uniref:BZIP domain-containing protein n=1 Tax=Myxozyma melibiosi TaxID=54550 RepID=A0ABR1F2M7_9ASCO